MNIPVAVTFGTFRERVRVPEGRPQRGMNEGSEEMLTGTSSVRQNMKDRPICVPSIGSCAGMCIGAADSLRKQVI